MSLTVQRDLKLVSECFASQAARKGAMRGSVQFHENHGIRQQTIVFAIVVGQFDDKIIVQLYKFT